MSYAYEVMLTISIVMAVVWVAVWVWRLKSRRPDSTAAALNLFLCALPIILISAHFWGQQ